MHPGADVQYSLVFVRIALKHDSHAHRHSVSNAPLTQLDPKPRRVQTGVHHHLALRETVRSAGSGGLPSDRQRSYAGSGDIAERGAQENSRENYGKTPE